MYLPDRWFSSGLCSALTLTENVEHDGGFVLADVVLDVARDLTAIVDGGEVKKADLRSLPEVPHLRESTYVSLRLTKKHIMYY